MNMMDNVKKTSYKGKEYTIYNFMSCGEHVKSFQLSKWAYETYVFVSASEVQECVTVSENYEAAAAFTKQKRIAERLLKLMEKHLEYKCYSKFESVKYRFDKITEKLLDIQVDLGLMKES